MTPLDLTLAPPRGPRETVCGVYFLPRTIDKMRAALPGGDLGGYVVDFPRGVSATVLARIGVDQAELQRVVAEAPDEAAVVAWLDAHADASVAPAVNAELESYSLDMFPASFRARVCERHPVTEGRPGLTNVLDIFEADDAAHVPRRP